jgi:two-component SAPR family response regulator
MIRIAAVDDELHVLERFERMVSEIPVCELCGLFESGAEILQYLKEKPLDAVFLDIEMPGVNGLSLASEILDINDSIDVIFVTAFNQYAVEAFELQAIDYIMKPLTENRLAKSLNRLLKAHKNITNDVMPKIQCIGDFEVFVNGEALTWKNTKAKEILAFLVHQRGIPVNWEKIADAIWPDYNYEQSHTNFHASTYLLRKRLAEAGISQIFENGRGNYRINKEHFQCDLYIIDERIRTNQMQRREDFLLLEQLEKKGYMEENGYAWSQPRAAELDRMCRRFREDLEKRR